MKKIGRPLTSDKALTPVERKRLQRERAKNAECHETIIAPLEPKKICHESKYFYLTLSCDSKVVSFDSSADEMNRIFSNMTKDFNNPVIQIVLKTTTFARVPAHKLNRHYINWGVEFKGDLS